MPILYPSTLLWTAPGEVFMHMRWFMSKWRVIALSMGINLHSRMAAGMQLLPAGQAAGT